MLTILNSSNESYTAALNENVVPDTSNIDATSTNTYESFLPHLLDISKYESGIDINRILLEKHAKAVVQKIVKVVQMNSTSTYSHMEDDFVSSVEVSV